MRFLSRSPCCFIVPRAARGRAMIGKRVHARLFTAFIDDQGASSTARVCMHDLGASSQLSRSGMQLFCFSPTSCSARTSFAIYVRMRPDLRWMEIQVNKKLLLSRILRLVCGLFLAHAYREWWVTLSRNKLTII